MKFKNILRTLYACKTRGYLYIILFLFNSRKNNIFLVNDTKNILFISVLDAGIRIPRGFLEGNTLDMGNYHQCLGINRLLEESEIQGKYCVIQLPLSQDINLPFPNNIDFDPQALKLDDETISMIEKYTIVNAGAKGLSGFPPGDRYGLIDYFYTSLHLLLR